jgi:hypothetical protein
MRLEIGFPAKIMLKHERLWCCFWIPSPDESVYFEEDFKVQAH